MSERYPILAGLPDGEALARRADAGQGLKDDELTRLGFSPLLRGLVLLPASGGCTPAQLERVFGGDRRALRDVVRACLQDVS